MNLDAASAREIAAEIAADIEALPVRNKLRTGLKNPRME